VLNIGVNQNVVSPGQTAGVNDAPSVTFAQVPAPVPQSVSPASGVAIPLSAPLRPSFVTSPVPAPPPTTTTIPAVMDATGTQALALNGATLDQLIGQFIHFPSSTKTVLLRGLLRKLIAAVVDSTNQWTTLTLDPPLPVAPLGRLDVIGASDPAPVAIIDATNTTPIVIETALPHGLANGDEVTVSGVGGNTAADGNWRITIVSPVMFSLNGSVGNGAYTPATGMYSTPIVITTATPHGYSTGDVVTIADVTGNTPANGTWTITVTGPTTFKLNGTAGTGTTPYAGGGSSFGPHDTFFVEEDPSTIVAKLFGKNGIVDAEPDATIYTTIPGKEVILS
jgi:hypothetical protein